MDTWSILYTPNSTQRNLSTNYYIYISLLGNRPHPSAAQPPFAESDQRRQYALDSCDARIHFALVCGAKVLDSAHSNNSKFCLSSFSPAQSCPAIQVYSGSNVERALTLAAGSFCSQEVAVSEAERRVTTSKIFHWYARDFGSTERERLQ